MAEKTNFIAKTIVDVVTTREENLLAVARCLERRLADLCNEGEHPPDNSPLTEWHLSRVLFDLLDSPSHTTSVASFLGIKD